MSTEKEKVKLPAKENEKQAKISKEALTAAKKEKRKQGREKMLHFFTDVRNEFKKITWPDALASRKKTVVVIVAIVISSAAIYGFDKLMLFLVSLVVSKA